MKSENQAPAEGDAEADRLLDEYMAACNRSDVAARDRARAAVRAAFAQPQPKGTVSEFTNELGNAIRITIEGPTSTSENMLTPMEVGKLRAALNEHAAQTPAPAPAGHKLVPLEPTAEMLAVVRNGPMHETWLAGWRAMVAAAPAIEHATPEGWRPTMEQFYEWCAVHDKHERNDQEAFFDAASLYLLAAPSPAVAHAPAEPDFDAWQCDRCNGDGWHYVEREGVDPRDIVRTKEHCEQCDGLGWLGPDAQAAATHAKEKKNA